MNTKKMWGRKTRKPAVKGTKSAAAEKKHARQVGHVGGGIYIFRESIATMFSVAAPLEYTRYMWGKGSLASLPGLPGHRTTLKEK